MNIFKEIKAGRKKDLDITVTLETDGPFENELLFTKGSRITGVIHLSSPEIIDLESVKLLIHSEVRLNDKPHFKWIDYITYESNKKDASIFIEYDHTFSEMPPSFEKDYFKNRYIFFLEITRKTDKGDETLKFKTYFHFINNTKITYVKPIHWLKKLERYYPFFLACFGVVAVSYAMLFFMSLPDLFNFIFSFSPIKKKIVIIHIIHILILVSFRLVTVSNYNRKEVLLNIPAYLIFFKRPKLKPNVVSATSSQKVSFEFQFPRYLCKKITMGHIGTHFHSWATPTGMTQNKLDESKFFEAHSDKNIIHKIRRYTNKASFTLPQFTTNSFYTKDNRIEWFLTFRFYTFLNFYRTVQIPIVVDESLADSDELDLPDGNDQAEESTYTYEGQHA